MASYLFVGLGNPGDEYTKTRHNTGFRLMERFAAKHGIPLGKKKSLTLF